MIKNLKLVNFRNFGKFEHEFSDGVNIIIAPNASGKTNILEAIFFLATGKSFKAKLLEEMIKTDTEVAKIIGETKTSDKNIILDASITKGFLTIGENFEKIPRKKLLVNNVARRQIDFAGNLKVALFLPEDIELVTGSPSKRRDYLNFVLSSIDRNYRKSLLIYEKGLRQRNKILLKIRDEGMSRNHLLFWNQILIKNGNYISEKREEFINNTNKYQFQINTSYQLSYDKSAISESRLEQYKNEEVASGTTLVGPHRDDFSFQILNPKSQILNLSSYGSRGEQRMGVLWLKMAELNFVEQNSGEKPTLLLDDIFSELDEAHRKIVVDMIQNHQVIMTTAEEETLPEISNAKLQIINL